ncbi:MAG: patatin-like phospholipase family protein [Myxococcales bacterium]|nr:patatin-like phospholipase family protein [Myxococcales bacterium]
MFDTLRIAGAFYGGNARLPFEAGVALALTELVVASRRHHGAPAPGGFAWLDGLDVALPRVHVDVTAGTSAGGIVCAVLTRMLNTAGDPTAVFATAARYFLDVMDVTTMMQPAQPCPTAILEKGHLTREGMLEVLTTAPAGDAPVLDPDAELLLTLTHATGRVEYFGDPLRDGGGPFEDVRYRDTRRFDRVDFAHRPAAVVSAVDATSANPIAFGPVFADDLDTPEGHAAWLAARAPHDATLPRGVAPAPAPQVAFFDGGTLDNRPLEAAIDAIFRRGLGLGEGERLALLLVDPRTETAADNFEAALDAAAGDVIEPDLVDQLQALGRAWRILRHERVADDLQRLVAWQDRVRLFQQLGCEGPPPDADALITAADLLLFNGDFGRIAAGEPTPEDPRLGLARTLAASAHDDPRRQAMLLAGRRIQRLLGQAQRWVRLKHRPEAADRLARIDALLFAERGALFALIDPTAAPAAGDLRRLVHEAAVGAPMPRGPRPGDRPVDVRIWRVGPPPEGLASTLGGGLAGFLDRDFRRHDLVVGIARGRAAVAALLPPAARAAWAAYFGLGEGWRTRCAGSTGGRTARWPGPTGSAGGARWRPSAPGDASPAPREAVGARPADAGRGAAYVLRRLWAMAATAPARRDNPLYALSRGVFAVFTHALVPRALRAEARSTRPLRTLKLLMVLMPVVYIAAVAQLAAWTLSLRFVDIMRTGVVSAAIGVTPPLIYYGFDRWRAAKRRRACALPPTPPP